VVRQLLCRLSWFSSVNNLTLAAALVAAIATIYFGLWPRMPVPPKRDDNVAYIGDAPAIRVLKFIASTDVGGSLRYHLVYQKNLPLGIKVGDVLTFRSVACAVIIVEVGKGLADEDPTRSVALCRVIGTA
jgi:hypothetical protein